MIGFGTGITLGPCCVIPAGASGGGRAAGRRAAAAPHFIGNYAAFDDPRLDIRLRDGRRELLRSEQRYDLITLEPPPPSAAGVVNLYSRDFYQLAAARLQPAGLVAQWLPLPTQNDEESRSLVRSFIDVFPPRHAVDHGVSRDAADRLVAAMPLDVARIRQRLAHGPVAEALAEVGIASPQALLATWITDLLRA